MTWLYLLVVVGGPLVLGLAVLSVGLLLFLTGTIGVDGLFSAADSQGTLTCWHCGTETPAGQRRCRHCDGELQ